MKCNEEWVPVGSLPGYEVSSLGRLRTWLSSKRQEVTVKLKDGREVVKKRAIGLEQPRTVRREAPKYGKSLIVRVWFRGRRTIRSLDMLVCEAFIRPREIPIHIDGDWGNNEAKNLRWGMRSEVKILRSPQTGAKLTPEKAAEIRRRIEGGERQNALAREFGVTECAISKIKNGKLWKTQS